MEWQDETRKYHNIHQGETVLIASIGPNLELTPPFWFDCPCISINTVYKIEWLKDWKPTYYVGVDARLFREGEKEIKAAYSDIPKFIPTPDRDDVQGKNFVRFYHRAGDIYIGGQLPNHPDALTKRGIAYNRILGAAFQVAYYMGFSRILVTGIQHKPGEESQHAWGYDPKGFEGQPNTHWFNEYRHWSHCGLAEVWNISEDTYVPDDVIPRDNWRNWYNPETITA